MALASYHLKGYRSIFHKANEKGLHLLKRYYTGIKYNRWGA